MIISENRIPNEKDFRELVLSANEMLNSDAAIRLDYYRKRGGNLLEADVCEALIEAAKGTPFENTIEVISGHKFPDIVAGRYYGVEVKSTTGDKWRSTGSSILESTRIPDVGRIYMTFGKLGGNPIEFISRPYEECLYEIAVTHMPRYLIDMNIPAGETIFDKMQIPYDELRQMDDPIAKVAEFYRKGLKKGERLWWAGNDLESTASMKVVFWTNVSSQEQDYIKAYGLANFPEVMWGEYGDFSMWLVTKGIAHSHVRDIYSSGGKEEFLLEENVRVKMPAVFRRMRAYFALFRNELINAEKFSACDSFDEKFEAWVEEVAVGLCHKKKNIRPELVRAVLKNIKEQGDLSFKAVDIDAKTI